MARATTRGSHSVQFAVEWSEDSDGKLLLMHASVGKRWNSLSQSLGRFEPLTLSAKSEPKMLAQAIKTNCRRLAQATEVKEPKVVTVEGSWLDNQALCNFAKALAEMPRLLKHHKQTVSCVGVHVQPDEKAGKPERFRSHIWVSDNKLPEAKEDAADTPEESRSSS